MWNWKDTISEARIVQQHTYLAYTVVLRVGLRPTRRQCPVAAGRTAVQWQHSAAVEGAYSDQHFAVEDSGAATAAAVEVDSSRRGGAVGHSSRDVAAAGAAAGAAAAAAAAEAAAGAAVVVAAAGC